MQTNSGWGGIKIRRRRKNQEKVKKEQREKTYKCQFQVARQVSTCGEKKANFEFLQGDMCEEKNGMYVGERQNVHTFVKKNP